MWKSREVLGLRQALYAPQIWNCRRSAAGLVAMFQGVKQEVESMEAVKSLGAPVGVLAGQLSGADRRRVCRRPEAGGEDEEKVGA